MTGLGAVMPLRRDVQAFRVTGRHSLGMMQMDERTSEAVLWT